MKTSSASSLSNLTKASFLSTMMVVTALLSTSCNKEDAQVDYFDGTKSYDIITPEPFIQGFVELMIDESAESIYMPEYAFKALDISEESRKEYLSSTKLVLLYSPEHHEGFEEYFVIDSSEPSNNITFLRSEEIGPDYPFISSQELMEDIDSISSILSSSFPAQAASISQRTGDIKSRVDALDEYASGQFSELEVSNLQFLVESEYMESWLEKYLPINSSSEIIVIEKLLTGEAVNLEEYLSTGKKTILISTGLKPKNYLQKNDEITNLRLVQFNVFKDGYNGPDSYFEGMVQNIKILSLTLRSK